MKGVARFFVDHSRYDLEYFFSQIPLQQTSWYEDFRSNGWSGIMNRFKDYNIWYFIFLIASMVVNFFLLICLFVFIRQKKIDLCVRIILLVMIIYNAMLTGPSGTTRFRLPIYLLMLIAFAVALPIIKMWFKKIIDLRHRSD